MRNFTLFAIALCISGAPVLPASADDCCGHNPPIRSIDRTCLPAGAPRPDLPLYTSDLAEQYQEIANVDSYISTDKCADTTRQQLKDLQAKGQAIGADALIRVRPLANNIQGWKENPDTPFWSVRQGASKDYFYRATAIKYLRWPKAEPKPLAVKASAQATAKQSSPLIDTNELLKLNRGKTHRNEVTVPEVYTTQQAQGPN
jgi:hypothetical protein